MTFRTWRNRLKNFRYGEGGADVNLADSNEITLLAHARQRGYV